MPSKTKQITKLRKDILDLIESYMISACFKRKLKAEEDYSDLEDCLDTILEDALKKV